MLKSRLLKHATDLVAALIGAGVIAAAVILMLEGGPPSSGLALLVAGLVLLPFIPVPGRGSRSTVFVIGLALAIGLPVMDSFERHRQSRAAVSFALEAAGALAQTAAQDGRWPADLKGLPDRISVPTDGFERDLQVTGCHDRSCALLVTLLDKRYKDRLQGHSFAVWTDDGGKTWACGPAGEHAALPEDLPSDCRSIP